MAPEVIVFEEKASLYSVPEDEEDEEVEIEPYFEAEVDVGDIIRFMNEFGISFITNDNIIELGEEIYRDMLLDKLLIFLAVKSHIPNVNTDELLVKIKNMDDVDAMILGHDLIDAYLDHPEGIMESVRRFMYVYG